MNRSITTCIKGLVPPCCSKVYRHYFSPYGFKGNYASWQEALRSCDGYDSDVITQKALRSALAVKNKEALFERDTVLFHQPDYLWPLLSVLWRAASLNNNTLCVLDFGGSLGSLYYRHKPVLAGLNALKWCVVEQPKIVDLGRKNFENGELKFYETVDQCFQNEKVNVVLMAGALQYLPEPFKLLEKVLGYKPDLMVFDKAPFLAQGDRDRLTVQKVPPAIYEASYPAWIFHREGFLKRFEGSYRLTGEYDNHIFYSFAFYFTGLIFERIRQ